MKRLISLAAFIAVCLSGCTVSNPTRIPPTPAKGYGSAQPIVDRAVSDLQRRLGVRAEDVTIQQVTETDFPDTSLGVPEPGKVYAQVITPGYVVRLSAAGKTYEYHGSGDRAVWVPEEQQPVEATVAPLPTSTLAVAGSTPPQVPPAPGNTETFQVVQIAEAGLAVEVPNGWLRMEPEWAWKPDAEI